MKNIENTGIQIASNNMDVYLELLGFFGSGSNFFNWDLLYIDGVSSNKDIPIVHLEEEVRQTKFGKRISYRDLIEYGHSFSLYDILIVGNQNIERKMLIDEDIEVVYKTSAVVIELFDSSYWRFFADKHIVDKAIESLSLKYEVMRL